MGNILSNLLFHVFIHLQVCLYCMHGVQDAGACIELRMFVCLSGVCRCRTACVIYTTSHVES